MIIFYEVYNEFCLDSKHRFYCAVDTSQCWCICYISLIRLHELRHSHASLLIELGFSPTLIKERLGHENIETTLNTYAHLYPNKQYEVSEQLEKLIKLP
ncbi:tyrosine-type recombinase/integrase [Megasphaera cerevisiae]